MDVCALQYTALTLASLVFLAQPHLTLLVLACAAQGAHEKAAMLYMKGGKLSKAVDMCFAADLFDVLGQIADDLSAGGDPRLFMK